MTVAVMTKLAPVSPMPIVQGVRGLIMMTTAPPTPIMNAVAVSLVHPLMSKRSPIRLTALPRVPQLITRLDTEMGG